MLFWPGKKEKSIEFRESNETRCFLGRVKNIKASRNTKI
jgi:hypothetical protein